MRGVQAERNTSNSLVAIAVHSVCLKRLALLTEVNISKGSTAYLPTEAVFVPHS